MAPDREICSKGGRATAEKHGPTHMAKIGREGGKKGIRGLADRYFDGSIGKAMSWLRSRRTELQIIGGLDEKQAAELASGKQISCEEIPVICDPECDPSYWRDRVSREDFEIPF